MTVIYEKSILFDKLSWNYERLYCCLSNFTGPIGIYPVEFSLNDGKLPIDRLDDLMDDIKSDLKNHPT